MNFRNFSFSFGRTLTRASKRKSSTKIKIPDIPKPFAELNITICGASSKIGRLSALLLKRKSIFKNIILWDEHYDMSNLVNLDLSSINTSTNFKTFCGKKGLVDAVSDSRIIYICDNIQTIPGVTPLDLFKSNANAVRQIILYISEFNPTAMVVIATPSVTSLVPMAYEEMLKNDCDAGKQIFGVAHNFLGIVNAVTRVFCPNDTPDHKNYVVGGCDRDTCIPVFSNSSSGKTLSSPPKAEENQQKGIRSFEANDVVKIFQNSEESALKAKIQESNIDGCYLSLAASGYQFVKKLAKALSGEENITDYAFVKQKTPRSFNERYLTCQVNLNKEGLECTLMPGLSVAEEENLKSIQKQLNTYIHAGEVYITGRDQIPEHRKKIVKPKEVPTPEPDNEPAPKEEELCNPRPKPMSILVKNQ